MPAAALFAAHRAFIAAASWARRSGDRLSFRFTFAGELRRRLLVAFAGDFAIGNCAFVGADFEALADRPSTAAALVADFLLAFCALAFSISASFRFHLASFAGPS